MQKLKGKFLLQEAYSLILSALNFADSFTVKYQAKPEKTFFLLLIAVSCLSKRLNSAFYNQTA
jgi:hypothetical protein